MLYRGNYVEAAANALAVIPAEKYAAKIGTYLGILGDAEKDAKAVAKTAKFADANGAKVVDEAADVNKSYDDLVRQAERDYPKLAGKEHNHHIDPKYLVIEKNGPTARINAAYHQYITNAFRELWAYGKKSLPSPEQLRRFKEEVYSKFPLPPTKKQ
jgi:hypothetical protein